MKRETAKDRENQRRLARRITNAWGYTFYEMPDYSTFDYLARGPRPGGGWSVWDMKHHYCPARIPFIIVDFAKVAGLDGAGMRFGGIPAYLGFSFTDDQARVLEIRRTPPVAIKVGGRTDRNDPADIDVVCHYLPEDMVVIP